jgi:pimeloyl-ACP methyl ester carboxylesterase
LEKLTDGLRIRAMDDRGHGRTIARADPGELKDWDIFARDLERFFEYLGEPVIAMGHSRGGVVSLITAVNRPDLVKALVLTDPTIIPFHLNILLYGAQMVGAEQRIPIAAIALKRKSHWPDTQKVFNSYNNRPPFKNWKPGFLERYIDCGFKPSCDGGIELACEPEWESRCFASCPVNIWRFIRRLQVPTLIIYGDGSDVFRPGSAKRFKRVVPQAELVCLRDTSHFVPMERPDETAEIIKKYLLRQGLV